ncbi:MAG: fibronectin type III domain-containing protein [Candidatus Pacebacteria bacterium]|nr:fibronectin type III domain-containing protein [Candidatus Paceibacterota bacterium]MBP9851406.1 fibronectin type III domain-containing protein [Candidatus Paceibacterota bacterium]
MKKIIKSLLAVALVLGSLGFGAPAFASAPPTIVSATASNITQTSAVFDGVVNPNGADTNAWFEFQVANSGQLSYQNIGSGTANVDLPQSYTATGLTPGTTYKFRIVAQNTHNGSSYTFHSWVSFTTLPNNPPQTTVSLFASPNSIQAGGSSQLSWSVTGWTGNCTATAFPGTSQWSGSKPWNGGPVTVSPNQTTTYTLTCNGVSGSDTVEVTQAPPPPPPANPQVISFNAFPMSVPSGGSTNLSWDSINTVSCFASSNPFNSQWNGTQNTSGSNFTITNLTVNTQFAIKCKNAANVWSPTLFKTVTVTNVPPPLQPSVTLTANPTSVTSGGATILSWNAQNATQCVANSNPATTWSGIVNANGGSQTVSNLTTTTFFNIFCTGAGGNDSATVTVGVTSQPPTGDAPTVTITAGNPNLPYGGATDIYWYPHNATSCTGTNGSGAWAGPRYHYSSSFYTFPLYQTTTYTITCSNAYGTSNPASVTVVVAPQQSAQPTVDLTASQNNLSYGGATNLNWGSSNATSCYANNGTNGWTGPRSVDGSFSTGNLYNTTTYSITCTGNGGTATDTVTVNVENQQNQQPSVTTYYASNIAQNSATLNGYLETYGQSTQRWFEWGTSTGSLYNQTTRQYQSYSGNFADSISGLQPRTTYYFRAAANGTYGNIYGSVATFTTTGDIQNSCGINLNCAPTAVTTIATNIDYNSARLNGLGLLNSSGNVTTNGYFRWGTTTALGRVTETKFIGSSSSNPYLQSLFGLTPNTTYYFQAVVSNQYGTSNGEIQTFRTGTFTTSTTTTTRNTNIIYRDVIPVTNVVGTVAGVGVSKPSLVYLTVNHQNESLLLGSELEYVFFYKNVSAEQLRDLVLQITLPGELRFLATSNGYYNKETRTVVVNIPALQPQEEGSVAVRVAVDNASEIGKVVAVTGNLAYTVVSSASQEEVFAYSRNTINGGQVLAGAVGFAGVLPGTLIGWILLILVILLIILLIRMLLAATERRGKDTQTSTTNTHTETHY